MTNCRKTLASLSLLLACTLAGAQSYTLTLEDCRQMAVEKSKELDEARTQKEMAGYDRKIALANYFPKVTAGGTYIYNNRDVSLVSEDMDQILTAIASVGNSVEAIAAINKEIDATLHPDLHNIWAGTVVVEQPVFVGGKIIYSNQMARLAEDLAGSRYDMAEAKVLLDVDEAYWQIVSIAAKKKLAESYAALLHHMEADVNAAIAEGVSTQADALQVKVKANEADMMLTKATNGLVLAKMLLCQRVGLPLESDITLADEALDVIPEPVLPARKTLEDIYDDRPETRSLELAEKIYDKKAKVVRADMLPTVALMGAYTLTNPNLYNGFQNRWQGGNLSAGVVVKIPIVHGGEGIFRYKKAKAEARLYEDKLSDARELIGLEVTQQRKLLDEARQKLQRALSNMDLAEENLRAATLSYEEGVLPTNTALAAHTAWLSAHSECIDAEIDLQMTASRLLKAEGSYRK